MLIKKMKFMYNLTSQEQYIVNYILENPSVVFHSTANELAKLTYSSSSTIVRLCKKLGLKGYPDFQLKFALEYKYDQIDESKREVTESGDKSLVKEIDLVPAIYEQALLETRKMFNEKSMINIIDWLKTAERIDVYGVDMNYYVAQQACAKWNEVGVMAVAYNSANQHYLTNLKNTSSTVSFVISHTGKNKAMIDIAKRLRNNNMKVIGITGSRDSTIAKICDECIITYSSEEQLNLSKIYSMMSSLYIFDVLYMSSFTFQQEE
ncbi:MurR/RpiR family transcriptional regulator [Robertmurraya sp. FSL R5-0851]|uniref:MurR/RpiR family transcriptional regulator n=1 Tax=Robertmurraya sp. FSL R5-0851 TaxID=2921584 RepID=UPI0030FAD771